MAIQKFVVSRDESVYEAWPDLIKTKSGKLLCVFTECEHHICRKNSRIVLTESSDRGRTWSKKRPISEESGADFFFDNARLSQLSDGRIAMICNRHGSESAGGAVQYLWFSEDEGTTWSEPTVLPFCGIVPDRFTEIKNGDHKGRYIVLAHYTSKETGKLEEYLWYSDDQGKTWSDRVTVAADPRYNLCEACVIECDDGTLVAFMRENSFEGYDVMKAISRDGGESWEGVYRTPITAGHRPTVGYLNDGRVMVTYRYVTCYTPVEGSVSLGLHNTFLTILKAEELTRTERAGTYYKTMPLDYDRNEKPDTGYTGWVQFEDGEIYVVNYIKDDADKAQIRGYSFYPNDIIL